MATVLKTAGLGSQIIALLSKIKAGGKAYAGVVKGKNTASALDTLNKALLKRMPGSNPAISAAKLNYRNAISARTAAIGAPVVGAGAAGAAIGTISDTPKDNKRKDLSEWISRLIQS